MTADPIPDRAELRARSAERLRRSVRLSMIIFVVLFLVLASAFPLLIDDLRTGDFLMAMLVGLAIAGAIFVTAVLVARRYARNPTLYWGTDDRTRRAVQRAFRDGRAGDPRTDALARELARDSLRRRWYFPLLIGLALLQSCAMIFALVDADWSSALQRTPLIAIFVVIAVRRRREVRRHHAYLREPGPADAPYTAA